MAGVALHVAPGAKILPVRVLNDDGRGSTSLVAEGIRQAAKSGAKVINMSLSTPTPARAMKEAVDLRPGARVPSSSRPTATRAEADPAVYPADFRNVISVVATDDTDVRGSFTNFGDKADVAAPGVNIVGPWRDGQYGVGSGTSYATPSSRAKRRSCSPQASPGTAAKPSRRSSPSIENIDKLNGGGMGFGRINLPAALLK